MNTRQKFFARPTTMGLALMNAAIAVADLKRSDIAVTVFRTISKNDDDPKRPFKSGYNVPEPDRVHAPSITHRMG